MLGALWKRLSAEQRVIDYYSAKSTEPTQARLQVGESTWGVPQHEDEVAPKRHESPNVGSVVEALKRGTTRDQDLAG